MSKKKKRAAQTRPPAQGQSPRKGAVPKVPRGRDQMLPIEQEVSEVDVLKFRISKLKDALMGVKSELLTAQQNVIGVQQANLELQQENMALRARVTAFEDERDLGHLHLQKGDSIVERDGKYVLLRKSQKTPPPVPPTKPGARRLEVVGRESEGAGEGDEEPPEPQGDEADPPSDQEGEDETESPEGDEEEVEQETPAETAPAS